MTDTRVLLASLKNYHISLKRHLLRLRSEYQQLQNCWLAFNALAKGNYAQKFSGGWLRTQAQFNDYINQSQKILSLLEECIADIEKFNLEESLMTVNSRVGASISTTYNQTQLSTDNKTNETAQAIVNISESYRQFTEDERALFLFMTAMAQKPKVRAEIAEGKGFEDFYIKTQLGLNYESQFHHNPEDERRRADAWAILEEDGKDILHIVEIIRSGEQFNSRSGRKFYQAKAYGDTLGHFLVLGEPVKLKYVFLEQPERHQIFNLQSAIKKGIEQAMERRFQELVTGGEFPSKLKKNATVNVGIEVWQRN